MIYAVTRGGARTLVSRSQASGVEESLGGNERHLHVGAWVPQVGGVIAIVAAGALDPGTLWWVKPGATPSLLLRHTVAVRAPSVSPDGRWLAYAASDTGRSEIYIRPLVGPGAVLRVSTRGGDYARWSKQGGELLYFEGDRMMAVGIERGGDTAQVGRPSQLFRGSYVQGGVDSWYDVTPDGRQFILLRAREGDPEFPSASRGTIVATNWIAELRERVR